MGFLQKEVSKKALIIGIVLVVAGAGVVAYHAGITEVATFEGMVFAALTILFLVMTLDRYEFRRRREDLFIEQLKQRRLKGDK